jgi:LytS/YehU family sensor histidine kinase
LVYPRFLKRRRIPLFIGGLVMAEILFIGLRFFIEELVYPGLIGHRNYDADTTLLYYIGDNWWRALQPILLSFIVWSFLDIFNREKETELLRREKTQTELAFLRSQINPHFLYNTLNYIYYLAYPVSDQLAGAIIKLSGLMRYMLAETVDGLVDLQMEVDYLHHYIDIYRLRFEDRFFVGFDIEGSITKQRIASLILIPFVENAFKHGVVDQAEDPVTLRLKVTDDRLEFTVGNRISHHQKDPSGGIGLANIRRRLDLIYPGRHTLTIRDDGVMHHTHLYVNFTH